jgi:hypothetical protein
VKRCAKANGLIVNSLKLLPEKLLGYAMAEDLQVTSFYSIIRGVFNKLHGAR